MSLSTVIEYYLAGTREGLSAAEARDVATERMPAVARPRDRADWYVAFLVTGPLQPGQHPFVLTAQERCVLASEPTIDPPLRRNIRIDVRRTESACAVAVTHGTVHVEAMGTLYATLALTPDQIVAVSRAGIHWSFD